jgi:dTMP kinase
MPPRGILVSIDGPGGAGKTTVISHLAAQLAARGTPIHTTAEPSAGPIGQLARSMVPDAEGWELACLFAADRYEHLRTEIRPRIQTGHVVVCDRYLASGLVVQRMDGIDLPFLTAINRHVDLPDLAVILTARPAVINRRVARRGAHNRYQIGPNAAAAELAYYAEAAAHLHAEGVHLAQIDTTDTPPEQIAATLADAITRLRESAPRLQGAA